MASIGTWTFSLPAVELCADCVISGKSCTDALEEGIARVEDDPDTGVYYVGRGCYPNADGIVQLDAALMQGRDLKFGSVCSLERFAKPILVARCVMDKSKHSMLVGNGAGSFARQMGFAPESNEKLMTPETESAFERYRQSKSSDLSAHDTLAVLCLDRNGDIAAGVSTSGPPFKTPGRVGDSPLPGCGLYADNKGGAAAATGDGDVLMRHCPSYRVVQLMREGASAQDSCDKVIREMTERNGTSFEAAVIALSTKGEFGAAGLVKEWVDKRTKTVYNGFPYAVWKTGQKPEINTMRSLET